VKSAARLILFFSITFILLLVASTSLLFFSRWIQNSIRIPEQGFAVGTEVFWALKKALSLTFYGTVLLSLSYSVRKDVGALGTLFILTLGGTLLTAGITEGLRGLSTSSASTALSKVMYKSPSLGEPGLIRTYTNESGSTIRAVLSRGGQGRGSLIALEGTQALRTIDFPAPGTVEWENPFERLSIGTLRNLEGELFLSSDRFFRRADQGWLSLLIFAGTLSLFLASFQFVLRLTSWPLANLFLGALLFRFLVLLEQGVYSEEAIQFLGALSQGLLPENLTAPVVLLALAVLVNTYTLLLYLSQDRRRAHGKR
jgi:hypothetical protein